MRIVLLLLLPVLGLSIDVFELKGAPVGWEAIGKASDSEEVSFRLLLKQENLDWLTNTFEAVSNPDDVDYGKHLHVDEINRMIKPSTGTIRNTTHWLSKAGILKAECDNSNVDSIAIVTTVGKTMNLFRQTNNFLMIRYRHSNTSRIVIAAQGKISIPDTVGVQFVTGLAFFPTPNIKPRRSKVPSKGIDNGAVGPESLYSLYEIDQSWFPITSKQAVVEFLDSGAYMPYYLTGGKGYESFFKLAGVNSSPKPSVVGPFKPDEGELEASLDIEYIQAIGNGAPTIYWTEEKWMLDFATNFFNNQRGVDVVSISFSWSEANQCTQPSGSPNPTCKELGINSQQYVTRTNVEYQKIGLSGVTIVVSSGDDGAPGNIDGAKCNLNLPLDPLFPASSPYVTTVGGTMIKKSISNPPQTLISPTTEKPKGTVTQKICHNSACTERCQTTELPIDKCLESADKKNSATVQCKLGSVVETIYPGSKNCDGFPDPQKIPCGKCIKDTAGTFVWFSCPMEEEEVVVPTTLITLPSPVTKKGTVTQKICHNSACTERCQTTELPIDKCLESADKKNSATVQCKLGSVVETIYPGSKNCDGFPDPQKIPCGKCIKDTAGTFVWFSCPMEEEEVVVPTTLITLPSPVTKKGTVTQKICHNSACTERCQTTELPIDKCLESADKKNSATVQCKLGSVVETIYPGSKNCDGFPDPQKIPCGKCIKDTAGTFVWFSCPMEEEEVVVPTTLITLPSPVTKKGTVTQKICHNSACTERCQTTELPIDKCLESADKKNSATVQCKLGSVVETIYPGSKNCDGFPDPQKIPCGKCIKDTAGTFVWFSCPMEKESSGSQLCKQNGGCITGTNEVVATYPEVTITSGGGFSNFAERPSYQEDVVTNYLKTQSSSLPPTGHWNPKGRGYPDVSALAYNYAVWMAMWMPTDGTSAAAPVVAGIFSCMNSQFKQLNASRLGFANPLLYKLSSSSPDTFIDITEGNNKCSSSCCGKQGYTAAKGWDPTTGLGSINAKKLINAGIELKLKKQK